MLRRHIVYGIISLFLLSCELSTFDEVPYDIIIVAGQSNTHAGRGLNRKTDNATNKDIFQLGRNSFFDRIIIPANEPLHHHTVRKNKIGFALTFAKLFDRINNKNPILIIPCGSGGSSIPRNWNRTSFLYNDLIERVELVLNKFPQSQIKAVLWHQGESDVGDENYDTLLDNLIENMRVDLKTEAPFVVGGMVPFWVSKTKNRIIQQDIIKNTPKRVKNTSYANPEIPFVIKKENNNFDIIHYDANGQRELGKRYFNAYLELENK